MPQTLRVIQHCSKSAVAASGTTANAAGQPVQRFVKELTRAGHYEVRGETVDIDGDMLDTFVLSFEKMKAKGVKVPVPSGHTIDPDKNRGWVHDMYRMGDVLMGVLELVGEDGIAMAGTNDVSIYAEPGFKDGTGEEYPWAVTHVALTPVPVVNGLEGFVSLSRAKGKPIKAPVFKLAQESTMITWPQVADALGMEGAEDLTDENAIEKLKAYAEKLKATPADKPPADAAAPPSPQVMSLARKARKGDIDRLVNAGKINPPVAAELSAIFVSDGALSLDMSDKGEGDARFDKLIAALDKINPVELGERVRQNAVALSRSAPGSGNDPAAYDPEVTKSMLALSR